MKRILIAVLMMLVSVPALAQDRTAEERRAAMQARRDSLETRVVERFAVRLGTELGLTDEQRIQTQNILIATGRDRRQLSGEMAALRARIARAVRTAETPDTDFAAMLSEFEALRVREHELARREQEQLAAILSPRQRAQFLIVWAKFQDDMREVRMRRMREERTSREHQPGGGPPPERAPADTVMHRGNPAETAPGAHST